MMCFVHFFRVFLGCWLEMFCFDVFHKIVATIALNWWDLQTCWEKIIECLCTLNLGSSMNTVSFDWFLSGLEWILNLQVLESKLQLLKVCFLKLLIFYQKLLWNIRSRLNSSTFWVFEPVFKYIWWKSSFLCTKLQFLSNIFKYRPKNSKCGGVEPRSDTRSLCL
jgi:hypothetical protein